MFDILFQSLIHDGPKGTLPFPGYFPFRSNHFDSFLEAESELILELILCPANHT